MEAVNPEKDQQAFLKALAKFQGAMAAVAKDAKAEAGKFSYSYLTLAKLREATAKPLADNGLAIIQGERFNDTHIILDTTLYHTDGGYCVASRPIATIDAALSSAQNYGSALSYARRYSYMALLGIAAEDDDGAAASTKDMGKTKKPPAKPRNKTEEGKPKNFTVQFVTEQGEVQERTLQRTPKEIKGMIERCEKSMEVDGGWWWAHRDAFNNLCKTGASAVEIFSPSLGNLTFLEWCDAQEAAHGEPEKGEA